jgi:hypothetical protein
MEKQPGAVEELIVKTEEYAKTSIELSRLKFLENTGAFASSVGAALVLSVILASGLLIASVGLAIYAGQLMGAVYTGFFAVGGLYILIGIFFYFFMHARIKKWFNTLVNKKIFS